MFFFDLTVADDWISHQHLFFAMIPLPFCPSKFDSDNSVPKNLAVFGLVVTCYLGTVHPGPTPGSHATNTPDPGCWNAELGAFIGQNCQGLGLTEVGFTDVMTWHDGWTHGGEGLVGICTEWLQWLFLVPILLMEEIPNNHLGCIKPCK